MADQPRGLGTRLHAGRAPGTRPALRGTVLQRRLDGLRMAIEAARGRLDDDFLDSIEASVARSADRLLLSERHTIVALAGSTGSGKSTTFNALVGAEVSIAGPERPTTSKASAVVWGEEPVDEVLDWLDIPARRRHRRSELTPRPARSLLPDDLVLLDLPDHDSIEVSHHEEAARVVELADLVIWVVDPQKYADAAVHRRFLQPLAGRRDVMMVVLNHIDTVPEDQRDSVLRDMRRVLRADGLKDPRILGTSATAGIGMDELRAAIRRRVDEKRSMAQRVEADIAAAARRLREASGDAPLEVPDVWVADLERRVAQGAGVPGLVERRERELRALAGNRAPITVAEAPGPVDRPAVDAAVRGLVDQVARDLTPAWSGPVRAVTAGLAATDERLDAELAALRLEHERPGWLPLWSWGRLAAVVLTAGALAWWGVARSPMLLVLAVVLGLVAVTVTLSRSRALTWWARTEAEAVEAACQRVITRVVRGHVIEPVQRSLVDFARFRRGLDLMG